MSKVAVEEKGSKVVVEYMIQQNRPYSATDVYTNLHQEFGKTLVVKCLDSGVQSGQLKEKVIGKQKIYFANQDNFPKADEEALRNLDRLVVEQAEQLKAEQAELKNIDYHLKTLTSAHTTAQLKAKVTQLENEISELEARLNALKGTTKQVTPGDKKKAIESRDVCVSEWRKRKRMANEMINGILENCPKKKKDLLEEMGVETDEDHQVVIPN
uniref:Homologous-pairing protein 2 homolog n=1 Tax=Plectus sambesii TaxID=2011161 RepID=A0A914XHF0_9BILA